MGTPSYLKKLKMALLPIISALVFLGDPAVAEIDASGNWSRGYALLAAM